jgi:4-hydroxy-4-methyl-2-oxoglutarate aldolase
MTFPLADIRRDLFASVLSDCLDAVGIMDQAMPARIRPLDEASVMVGRARTAQFMEVERHEPGTNPYELEISLVDSLAHGDIPVFACVNPARIAPWGELLSTAALVRGAAGALMDGAVRDIKAIRTMGFPVFHGGIGPLDTKGRGRVIAIDLAVRCAGVKVESGDLVFGDADGVVIVPRAVEGQVLALAFEKIRGEKRTLDDLRAGEKLADVFAKYGIL